jgi:hypothetical protein
MLSRPAGTHRNWRLSSPGRSTASTGLSGRVSVALPTMNSTGAPSSPAGTAALTSSPAGTVERRLADRFQAGPEAFPALWQCLIPHLSPGIVAGEIRPD